jgi:hypothetical protein
VTDRRLRIGALIALVLGVGLMVPFEHPATLALGAACLFAFIALGLFGLLAPERLRDEEPSPGEESVSR